MDRRQKLVIAELVVLCLVVLGNFVNEFLGFLGFFVYEALCTAIFFAALYEIRKEFKKEFKKYFAYFSLLFAIVLYSAYALITVKGPVPNLDIFFILIISIILVNVFFRVVLGKTAIEAKVLLSDSEIAVVEIPFDLFAGINSGRYVVKTDRNLKKGETVNVLIKRRFFNRIPERVL